MKTTKASHLMAENNISTLAMRGVYRNSYIHRQLCRLQEYEGL